MISFWTMDMQVIKLNPKKQTRCMFYKTKLQLHVHKLFNTHTKTHYLAC